VGSDVQVEDVFHLGDEAGRVAFWHAPALLPPRLQFVFLSTKRTASPLICVTSRRRQSSSASNCNVQRVRPLGGGPQQMAIRCASTWPSILGGTGGVSRDLRSKAGCSPSQTKRLRMRATVLTCMPKALAIWASTQGPSGRSRSASNKTRAWRVL